MKAPNLKSKSKLLLLLAMSVALGTAPVVHNVAQASEVTQDESVASVGANAKVGPRSTTSVRKAVQEKHGYSNEQIVHLLNRVSFGPGPGDIAAVKKMGVDAYIEQQLHPQTISVPDTVQQLAQVPALSESPAALFQTYGRPALKALAQNGDSKSPDAKKDLQKMVRENYQKLYEDTATARVARAVYSPAQLQEVMTDFWYNHFNISIDKNLDHLWVGAYEETAIRPYALGKFRDLLGATAHHAAMLFYLDNWQNTAPGAQVAGGRFKGINENYARELMELHTLGVDGGYTQKDVQELARILTGLGLPPGAGLGQQQGKKRRLGQGGGGGIGNGGAGIGNGGAGIGNGGAGIGNGGAGIGNGGAGIGNGGVAIGNGGGGIGNGGGGFGNGGRRRRLAARGIWQPGAGQPGQGQMSRGQVPQAPGRNVDSKLGSYFDARRHDFGDKVVVGHHIGGTGENEIEEVLDLLAKHPSTAHHISYQLAQYFVSDKPPASLVDKMSKRFLDSDGDIPAVLETLFHSPEFWDESAVNAKFKSPYRYLVSSLRASDAELGPIRPSLGILTQLGMPLYKCLTPDGYKNTKEAWLNPDGLLNRINFATALGTGHFKGATVRLQDPADLADCIGPTLSDKTIDAVMKSPENMRISLLLGSPEFMKY